MKELDVNNAVFTTASKPDYLQGKCPDECEKGSMKSSGSESKVSDKVTQEKGKKVEY